MHQELGLPSLFDAVGHKLNARTQLGPNIERNPKTDFNQIQIDDKLAHLFVT